MTIRIRETNIIGTKFKLYSAWTESAPMGIHSTVTSFEDHAGWWGRVGTERLPPEIGSLQGDERSQAARSWRDANYESAYTAIIEAHPEAANGARSMGEIEIRLD